MTAREAWKACEARLAVVVAQIAAIEEWKGRDEAWERGNHGMRSRPRPPQPEGDWRDLILEREALQQESFRLWQRMRAEVAR